MPPKVMVNVSQCRELCAALTGGAALHRIGLMPSWPSWVSSRPAASAGTLEEAARPPAMAQAAGFQRRPFMRDPPFCQCVPAYCVEAGAMSSAREARCSAPCRPVALPPCRLVPAALLVCLGRAQGAVPRQGQRGRLQELQSCFAGLKPAPRAWPWQRKGQARRRQTG